MYVGGYFSDAMGTNANSIAMVNMTNRDKIEVKALQSSATFGDAPSSNGVDGVVMSVSAINESSVVFGGIYTSNNEGSAPYMFNMWDPNSGITCVLNQFMGLMSQCQVSPPPPLCCEGAVGTIYSTLKVSDDEVLIGGEFFNTFSPGAANEIDPSKGSANDVLQFKVGYQNLALLPLQSISAGGESFIPSSTPSSNRTKNMLGGPNGEVLTLTCAHWSESLNRCVEVSNFRRSAKLVLAGSRNISFSRAG